MIVQSEPGIDVVFVLQPSSLLLDLAGPAEAFRLANEHAHEARFRLRYVGPSSEVRASTGVTLGRLEALPGRFERRTWVVLVGQTDSARHARSPEWKRTSRWLAQTVRPLFENEREPPGEHKLITVCAGALLAADAGLIGARRVTTHHDLLARLERLSPRAEVVADRVFVEDGPLASSAGITAGIDLALHLVAAELDEAVAAAVAQTMVVYLRRGPQDPELSPYLAYRNHLHPVVHRVQDAVSADPTLEWSVDAMARAAEVNPRHLGRLFMRHAGVSPLAYVIRIRLERARRALGQGANVTRAAEQAGFSSDVALRRAWSRYATGTPRQTRAMS